MSSLQGIPRATGLPHIGPIYSWKGQESAALNFDNVLRILLAVLLAVVTVAIACVGKRDKAIKRIPHGGPLPPGPRPWPIIGSLGILGPLVHQDLARLSKKYGSVMLLRLGSINTVVISSPKAAQELLTKYDRVVAARPKLSQFQLMLSHTESLTFSSYGPYWRMLRKVFTLELMTTRRMHQFEGVRKDSVLYVLETLLRDCKGGNVLQMRDRFSNATNDTITRMAINKHYFGRNASTSNIRQLYIDTFAEVSKIAGAFVPGDYIPLLKNFDIFGHKKKMRAIRTTATKVFAAIVDEHRKNHHSPAEAKDFVDVLLDTGITDDNTTLNDAQIQAFLQEVMVAGTETTSTAMEWTLAELLRNPSIMRRVQVELDNVVGRDRLVEESDIAHLPYLNAVVKENFRLHPVVPLLLPRWSTEPCEVEGYHIPTNSLIFVNTWAIGRDPNIWNDALKFSPERFLNSSIDTAGQHFELLPFGAGRRGCPGRSLGLMLVQYMLAAILHTFECHLPFGSSTENMSMDETQGSTAPRAHPLQLVASPRLPPSVLSRIYQC